MGASSFHLWWQLGAGSPLVEARATLEVVQPPTVDELYFWALQVSFSKSGRSAGGAHTGLQHHPQAPEGAINWGGYDDLGSELQGTISDLPSADSGPNTRCWAWYPHRRYRFRVWSPSVGVWRSEVTDLEDGRSAVIRDLLVDADQLVSPVVWTEAFCRCVAPLVEVRWSDLEVVDAEGLVRQPSGLSVTYQSRWEGGCPNTEAVIVDSAVAQRTGLDHKRRRPQLLLPWPP